MTWSRFDDGYDEHDKVEEAWDEERASIGLHAMATTACSRWQSDGVIKPRWLKGKLPDKRERERVLAAMVKHGLFDELRAGATAVLEDDDGDEVTLGPFAEDRYVVHDFLKFHDSASKRSRNREWDRRRKELERDRDLVEAIRARDKDRCRYCGLLVNWKDRRSPKGGTYDHVIPRGDNSLENVVVACRGCNNRKGPRTPEQAGIPLLTPGQVGSDPDLAAGQKRSGRTKPGAESVQATRPDPTRPDPEAPQPPQAGVQWPGPPTKPTGGRQRDLAAWEQQMDAYATWLMPDIDESGRTDLVRAALGFAERCGSATNDRVRATALQLQGERVEAA